MFLSQTTNRRGEDVVHAGSVLGTLGRLFTRTGSRVTHAQAGSTADATTVHLYRWAMDSEFRGKVKKEAYLTCASVQQLQVKGPRAISKNKGKLGTLW